jgi:hypothetical protein
MFYYILYLAENCVEQVMRHGKKAGRGDVLLAVRGLYVAPILFYIRCQAQ